MIPEPTILEMLNAATIAIRGSAEKNADFVRGSDYESLSGPCAVIWSREAQRDTDLFNAVNFHTAEGSDLTELALKRYGKQRILDSRGTGTVTLERPDGTFFDELLGQWINGTIEETIWKGTRILIVGSSPKIYRTTEDVFAGQTDLVVVIPIEAEDIGPGSEVNISDPAGTRVRVHDQLEDVGWKVTALTCADGTLFEQADAFRTRIRKERLAERVGQTQAIIDACEEAGASNVALFRSDYAGPQYDYGLNVVYVGDSGYNGTPELVEACILALQSVRIAGVHLQVLPMAPASIDVTADIYLIDTPGLFDLDRLREVHEAGIRQYMNGESGRFSYARSGILGAIILRTPEVQRVNIISPATDASVVEGPMKNFVPVLKRYVVNSINLRYLAS